MFSNLRSLSFKRCNGVTAEGITVFADLVDLVNLGLEGCLSEDSCWPCSCERNTASLLPAIFFLLSLLRPSPFRIARLSSSVSCLSRWSLDTYNLPVTLA